MKAVIVDIGNNTFQVRLKYDNIFRVKYLCSDGSTKTSRYGLPESANFNSSRNACRVFRKKFKVLKTVPNYNYWRVTTLKTYEVKRKR